MRAFIFSAVMFASLAVANNNEQPQDPVDPVQPVAIAGAASLAGAAAVNDVAVEAEGGKAVTDVDVGLVGGDTSSDSKSKSKSSSESGAASVINYSQPRQVPPVFLPALMVSDCGAGASAGASDKGGAGAFGIVWTTKKCYALRTAINFFAIGEYQTGCELLVWINKKAFDEIGHAPDCALVAAGLHAEARANRDALERDLPVAPPVQQAQCPQCATKEELDRAFKQSIKK